MEVRRYTDVTPLQVSQTQSFYNSSQQNKKFLAAQPQNKEVKPVVDKQPMQALPMFRYSYPKAAEPISVNTSEANAISLSSGQKFNVSGELFLKIENDGISLDGLNIDKCSVAEIVDAYSYAESFNIFVKYVNGYASNKHLTADASRKTLEILNSAGINTDENFSVNGTVFTTKNGFIQKQNEAMTESVNIANRNFKRVMNNYMESSFADYLNFAPQVCNM